MKEHEASNQNNLVKGLQSQVFKQSWHVVIPFAFFIIMLLFYPFREEFEFDGDEGVELMKAMLLMKGHSLYDQIWSDHPPLFTHILGFAFQVAGFKVNVGRFLVLLLSSGLLWALIKFVQIVWGNVHALAGGILLFLLPEYLKLSVSTMIGLPSLSFAMFSLLTLTIWHTRQKDIWLILSASLLVLSIFTKAFTGFLVPIFPIGILIAEYIGSGRDKLSITILRSSLVWIASFTIFSITLVLLLIGPDNVMQLIEPHLTASSSEIYRNNEIYTLNFHLQDARPFLFLALIGTLFTMYSRRWLSIYPFVWMATGYIFLFRLVPVWDHLQLLITIPATILAAIAVGETVRLIILAIGGHLVKFNSGLWIFGVATVIGTAFLISIQVPKVFGQLNLRPTFPNNEIVLQNTKKLEFLKLMNDYSSETQWVVTDVPMYAFRARLPVPPQLAVFSSKRLETGNLTEEEVINIMRNYQPEQVLMRRFKLPKVEKYIAQHYILIHSNGPIKLFVLKKLQSIY